MEKAKTASAAAIGALAGLLLSGAAYSAGGLPLWLGCLAFLALACAASLAFARRLEKDLEDGTFRAIWGNAEALGEAFGEGCSYERWPATEDAPLLSNPYREAEYSYGEHGFRGSRGGAAWRLWEAGAEPGKPEGVALAVEGRFRGDAAWLLPKDGPEAPRLLAVADAKIGETEKLVAYGGLHSRIGDGIRSLDAALPEGDAGGSFVYLGPEGALLWLGGARMFPSEDAEEVSAAARRYMELAGLLLGLLPAGDAPDEAPD